MLIRRYVNSFVAYIFLNVSKYILYVIKRPETDAIFGAGLLDLI